MSPRDRGDAGGISRDRHRHYVDRYTGDGALVLYSFTRGPVDTDQLQVFVDGKIMLPAALGSANDYTATESTVTFTVAPANLKSVQFHYLGP